MDVLLQLIQRFLDSVVVRKELLHARENLDGLLPFLAVVELSRPTEDGRTGLRAMVGAWWCHHEAQRLGCNMTDLDLMKAIKDYNEVDCRVMWEAVRYLREAHRGIES